MNVTQVKNELVELIQTVCTTTKPNLTDLDRPLLESGLDSLDYVSVLMAIEDKYNFSDKDLTFASVDMEDIQSVNAIIAHMESHNIIG